MRNTIPVLTIALGSLALSALLALHWMAGRVLPVVLSGVDVAGAPSYVQAGVPFLVRDSYAAQICISTRSGRPLLPFVGSAAAISSAASVGAPAEIQAGVPFVARDQLGSEYCVSSRGGELLPPFIAPEPMSSWQQHGPAGAGPYPAPAALPQGLPGGSDSPAPPGR